jgi:hypothetical protein
MQAVGSFGKKPPIKAIATFFHVTQSQKLSVIRAKSHTGISLRRFCELKFRLLLLLIIVER